MHRDSNRRRPTRDHAIAKSRGGDLSYDNIVIACLECNGEKGSLLPEEYMAWREGRASRLDKGYFWRLKHPAHDIFKEQWETNG